ncbi:Hypothetical protein NCS54_00356700 [Fusarium falciforme]|uniref:Hypothetical protein n=1 Tax=Fusarium falciforme TaxID=195108 RepID=UPI002300C532|nr:Hypothetical protein NCS54_00356700 [Fusarium falciforme]WAO86295.1 Hypothetical protein NCS54_00356700 [Fusarium falciforme]
MPRGRISHILKLSKIEEGLKVFVTDVRFTIPEGNGKWAPSLSTPKCIFHTGMADEEKKKALPIEISQGFRDGYIGEVCLTSTSVFDSGIGPTVEIDIAVLGEVSIKGDSEWGGWMSLWGNADTVMVAYSLIDSGTVLKNFDIPVSGHTKPLHLGLEVDEKKEVLALKLDIESNWIFDGVNLLLGGVYYAHDVTYGYVFGALGGWPAAVGYVGGDGLRNLIFPK